MKNVLIWQEGITSKNGQSIAKWAASATNTNGTDATVTMIQNCRNYYEKHSDLYEIVNSGVYWLQGESDTAMDPALYTQLFMAIWERLENAGMNYLAFLRLRWGVNGNGLDHQDLHHSASLSAQIQMINENPNFYMATDLTENWVGTETTTHTVDISKYITVMEAYGNNPTYTDVYGNHATYADGKLTTTMKSLYGSNNKCHYGKFGYGLIGADAAYNMYNALKKNDSAIVVTDTSGHANRKQLLTNGQQMTIDITNMSDDLSFRPACGSTAGTLEIVIRSGKDDITNHDGLLIADGLKYGSICVSELRNYNNASIEITYNTANGKKHTAVCNVITQLAEPKKVYIWNFNEDLYARDEEDNILNSFLIEPLAGSYTLEKGYLTGNALMLQLEQLIELEADKNWCVEWKYGTFVNGSAGFLLCEDAANSIGNKAFYHTSTGRMMISDYADKKGYRNYTSAAVVIDEYDCLRITNRYDPTAGKSMLSLWKNGELVIDNFQMKGSLNSDTDNLDMTGYPLVGNFAFGYLGHDKNSLWGMNCELDYLHISFGEEKEWCDNAFGPVIIQQPMDDEAKLGERYMVEVKAEGEGLTYQWYGRNAGSKSWFKSSVKDNTYDDVMTEARSGREVYCVITDTNGNSVITDTVKLICLPSEELEITQQPTDGETVMGERFCVTVEAKGEKLKYQWYFRNKGTEKWTKSGVTDNTYDDVMTTARAGREIYCVITDAFGNKVTTDTVKLVRIPMTLEIVTQPTDTEAAFGELFCATVEAKGEGLKYQWYYRNAGSEEWHKSGVRDNTYDDEMTKARAGREIYCVITDQWGSTVTTDTVTLTAVPSVALEILTQPEDAYAAMGEMFCVTVEAQGDGLKYQWYGRNAGSDSWFKSSVTDNTYDDVMTKSREDREVYCVITDALGNTVTTNIVKLICVEEMPEEEMPSEQEIVEPEQMTEELPAEEQAVEEQVVEEQPIEEQNEPV